MNTTVDDVAALLLEVANLLGEVVELAGRGVGGGDDGSLELNLDEVRPLL